MKEWFLYSIITLLLWSLWSFFPKIAHQYISPQSILIYQVVGHVIIGLTVLFSTGLPQVHNKAMIFSILAGMAGIGGTMFFLLALSKHSLSVVAVFTALYPIITIALSYLFFNETVTIKQGIGIIFALIAIALFYA